MSFSIVLLSAIAKNFLLGTDFVTHFFLLNVDFIMNLKKPAKTVARAMLELVRSSQRSGMEITFAGDPSLVIAPMLEQEIAPGKRSRQSP